MKYISIIFFLFFALTTYAQKIIIIDAETGKPIEKVNVFNAEKSKTGITDEKGKVDISDFSKNEIIHFSHVAYSSCSDTKASLGVNQYKVFLSKDSEALDEIVLSVFKNDAKANRIAEQIAVIKHKEIKKLAAQTSADVLANVPGIKVQKSQFGGGSPVLRGLESNRVLLVVDGVRLNNAIFRKGHLQNSITVSPNLLDRVEVVFGPSSVIYGSDALGGVIHYYTKTPKLSDNKEIKANLFSRFASANEETTNQFSLEISQPKWSSLSSVAYSDFGDLRAGKNRRHGFEDWGKVFYYSKNTDDDFFEEQSLNPDPNIQLNTGFNQLDILQKIYVPITEKTDFKLNFQYSTTSDIPRFDRLTETNDDGTLRFAEWDYGPQNRLLISPQLAISPRTKLLDKGTITLAYQNIQESRIQRRFGTLERTHRIETVDVYSLNGDFSAVTARNRELGYGFEVVHNDVDSNSFGRTLLVDGNNVVGFDRDLDFAVQSRYADGGSSYFTSALYTNYRQDLSSKSTLNTGVRFTYTNLRARWIDETFITLPDNDINLNNSALTATAGYVLKPNDKWQLNTVLSTGFRSPNIDDVARIREKNGNVTIPNVDLEPEYAHNFEIGVQKFFNNKKFNVGFNAYYTLLQNYIFRENTTLNGESTIFFDGELGNIVANVNRDFAYVTGFTASYQGKLFKHWNTSGSLTFTEGKAFDTGEVLSSIPPLFGNFDISYQKDKIDAGLNFRFNGRKKSTDFNITEGIDNIEQTPLVDANATEETDRYFGSPAWFTFGVYNKYNFTENIAIQARLNNIFDVHYREFASGISAPGRDLSLSLFVNF